MTLLCPLVHKGATTVCGRPRDYVLRTPDATDVSVCLTTARIVEGMIRAGKASRYHLSCHEGLEVSGGG